MITIHARHAAAADTKVDTSDVQKTKFPETLMSPLQIRNVDKLIDRNATKTLDHCFLLDVKQQVNVVLSRVNGRPLVLLDSVNHPRVDALQNTAQHHSHCDISA